MNHNQAQRKLHNPRLPLKSGQSHLISPKEGCAWFSTVSGKFLKTAIASSDNAIANKGIFQSLLLIF